MFGNVGREEAFAYPMSEFLVRVVDAGEISDGAIDQLRADYGKQKERWRRGGEFRDDTRAPFVRMFLGDHIAALRQAR